MMGRQNNEQGPLFYEFRLDEAVPADHQVHQIDAACRMAQLACRVVGLRTTI